MVMQPKRESVLPYVSRAERKTLQSGQRFMRTSLGKTLRIFRAYDKKDLWTIKKSTLRTVMRALGTNLPWRATTHIKNKGSCVVLDIGCLDGTAIAELKKEVPNEAHGLSLSRMKEWKEEQNKGVKFHVGLFETNKFPSDHFNLIYGNSSIMHSPNFSKALEQMHRILKKDGEAVFD